MSILGTVEEVIRRARAGDRDALAELWRTHNHLLLRYFRGKGVADPDDLASTVWVEVAGSLHRFEGDEADFRRWLFTIAARRRIDGIRAGIRRKQRLEREQQHHVADTSDLAARGVEQSAELDRALALIRTLPPDQAEAVLLRVLGDFSVAEVAEIMGRRDGAVRVLVHRGLKRLASRPGVTDGQDGTMSSS
jgi:RNA polymerase sigma-70 factor, ECF subfamily